MQKASGPKHHKAFRNNYLAALGAAALLLLSLVSEAQLFPINNYGNKLKRGQYDSVLAFPTGCGTPSANTWLNNVSPSLSSRLYFDTCGHVLWVYDNSTSGWAGLTSGAVTDTSHLSTRINLKLNFADTVPMLFPYAQKNQVVMSVGVPFFSADVAANRPAFGNAGNLYLATDTKLLYRDNGGSWDLIGGGGGGGTTLTGPGYVKMSGGAPTYITSIPHADIAGTAVTPGSYTNSNITVQSDGTITAIANGSSGGGSPNTSLGGQANIAITGTNNVKTLGPGLGIKVDTATTNVVKPVLDTTLATGTHQWEPFYSDSTKKYATPKQIHDSIAALPSDTLHLVNAGTGITLASSANDTFKLATLVPGRGFQNHKLGDSSVSQNIDTTQQLNWLLPPILSSLPLGGRLMIDPTTGALTTQAEIVHTPATAATTAALPTNTYSNGTAGVGATLTATGNAALTVDGVALVAGNRVLVKNEAAPSHNGLYTVTQAGSVSTPYILTRGNYSAIPANLAAGSQVFIQSGTVNAGITFYQTTTGTITIGTTSLVYVGTQVPANSISNTQAVQMPTLTIKGNNTVGTANPLDLTTTQINTMIDAGITIAQGQVTGLTSALAAKIANNGASTGIQAGTHAARPSASTCNCYYVETDSARLWYDNGAWIQIGGGTGGGSTVTGSSGINVASGNATLDTTFVNLFQNPILPLWRYADTTGVIDATPALKALIAIDSASGFRYTIELGPYQYKIAGPLQSDCNCIIRVPTLNPSSSTKQGVFALHGSPSTTMLLGGGYGQSVFPKPTTGTRLIVSTPATFTNGLYPAVFGADNVGSLGFSYTAVDFKDFSLQLYTNHATIPMRMSGLMLGLTATGNIERVYVTPDTNVQVVPAPDSVTCGICLSKFNDNGANHIARTVASGFTVNYFVGEHTTLDMPYAFAGKFGFASAIGGYPISGEVLTHGCRFSLMSASTQTWFGLYVPGSTIWNLTVHEEQNAKGFWYDYVGDINDSSNFANGWVHYFPSDSTGKGLVRINGGLHLNVIRGDVQDSMTLTAAIKLTGFIQNQIPFMNSSQYLTHGTGLVYNPAVGLGIGGGVPAAPLYVSGTYAGSGNGQFRIEDNVAAGNLATVGWSLGGSNFIRTWNFGMLKLAGSSDPNYYARPNIGNAAHVLTDSAGNSILKVDSSGITEAKLGGNGAGYIAVDNNGKHSWSAGPSGGSGSPGGTVAGDVQIYGTSTTFSSPSSHAFFFNTANTRMGIGAGSSPSAPLHIKSTFASTFGTLALQDPTNSGSSSTIYISFMGANGTRNLLFGQGSYLGATDPNFYYVNEMATGNHIFRNSSGQIMQVTNGGNLLVSSSATDHAAFVQTAANTATNASLYLAPSAGVAITTPTSGMLWWDGTALNFRGASSVVNLMPITSTWQQTLTAGATMTANNAIAGASHSFSFNSTFMGFGATGTTASLVSLGANTTTASQINFLSSSGTNVTSPVDGDIWYNGTNLNFRHGSTTSDLLAGGGASGANPTGTIGLTAVNGSSTSFLRADGAPALSQAIIPTWTNIHTFSAGVATTTIAGSGSAATAAVGAAIPTGGSGAFISYAGSTQLAGTFTVTSGTGTGTGTVVATITLPVAQSSTGYKVFIQQLDNSAALPLIPSNTSTTQFQAIMFVGSTYPASTVHSYNYFIVQ